MDAMTSIIGNPDTLAAFEALTEEAVEPQPPTRASDDLIANEEDIEDTGDTEGGSDLDDASEVSGDGDEAPAPVLQSSPVDDAYLALQAQIAQSQAVIAEKQRQLDHLVGMLNAPKAVPFEDLPEAEQAKYIAEAAPFKIDPAYLHYQDWKNSVSSIEGQRQQAVSAVSAYIDGHPESPELNAEFAAAVRNDPRFGQQFRSALLLPPEEMYRTATALADGLYAQLRLQKTTSSAKQREAAIAAGAAAKANEMSKAKARTRGEGATRAGIGTSTKVAKEQTAMADDILAAAKGTWGNFFGR